MTMNEEEIKAGIQKEAMAAEAEETATASEAAAAEESEAEGKTAGKKANRKTGEYKRVPEFLEPYLRRYSGEKVFHVTSDRQVFLDKNKHLARLHQESLGEGKLKTYNI